MCSSLVAIEGSGHAQWGKPTKVVRTAHPASSLLDVYPSPKVVSSQCAGISTFIKHGCAWVLRPVPHQLHASDTGPFSHTVLITSAFGTLLPWSCVSATIKVQFLLLPLGQSRLLKRFRICTMARQSAAYQRFSQEI